ncbi:hypothetical protein [Pedobacter montanisoli]|uniref:Uncharacterized protein n=1 Tax=Pedobacter montanisoli TaxID=2923277 RepID=A0ABS9ZZJ6_9SPHI|nr:hypothetical protein [Pedobacter montanisoli]MCJ0743704.1 hypothetical protein [Pedobacter montanisoli]
MKISIRTLLLAFFAILIFSYGCKKYDVADKDLLTAKTVSPLVAKAEMTSWIDRHVATSQAETQSYHLLKQNLNYEAAHVQKRKNGEDVLVIPVNDAIREKLKLNANYALKVITVKKNGKPRWSMIIAFLAGDGKTKSTLNNNSIQGIVNNERLEEDGLYKFFDLKGRLLYQVSYKDKKITSYGAVQAKDKRNGKDKVMSTNGSGTGNSTKMLLPEQEDCTEYYLVTTYYDQYGNPEYQTWEYLFTLCKDGNGGGGGGGGGGTPPEDPIDVEMTQEFSFPVAYTSFRPEDYRLPEGALSATPEGTPLTYDCKVSVTFASSTRKIHGVQAYPLVIHPANETYLHPEYGRIVRNVTPFSQSHNASYAGQKVSAYWTSIVNFRWAYLDRNSLPNTDDLDFNHSTSFIF